MDLQLTGRRVLVTGGTRGIGRAIVAAFLDEGATVGFCARNADEVASTAADLSDRGEVIGTVVDVADGEALAAWVDQSAERVGGLDVVVANVVSPGNTYFDGGVWQNIEDGNPALFELAMSLNPTGEMGTPEEVAAPVVFLASPVASRVSGTNLVVDGALTRGIQL